jgi:hypothetical protein
MRCVRERVYECERERGKGRSMMEEGGQEIYIKTRRPERRGGWDSSSTHTTR